MLTLLLFLFIFGQVPAQNTNTPNNTSSTIDSLLTIIKKDEADTNKVNHFIFLTDEFKRQGDVENGLKYVTEALALSRKLNFKNGTASLYFNIADLHLLQADYSKALEYYQKALTLYEDLKNRKEIARCLLKISAIHITKSNYPLALSKLFKALAISQEIKNKESEARCLLSIGGVYFYQGHYPIALTYFLKSLKLTEEEKNETLMTTCLLNIGSIYFYQNEYKKALEYYSRALKLTKTEANKPSHVKIRMNTGVIYQQQKDYSAALEQYFKAQELLEELKDKQTTAMLYINIGECLMAQKYYSQALNYLSKAFKMANELGDRNLISAYYDGVAQIHLNSGNFKEAEKFTLKAIAIADSIGSMNELMNLENALSTIYDTTEQYKKALIHYKKATELKDTLFSQENKKELIQKAMTYEFDKKAGMLKAENEKQQAIAEQKAQVQNIIIWSVTVGLILVFIFAGLIFRSLYTTRKQKNIIELQKNEVSKQKEIADSQRIIAEELRSVAEKQKEIVQEKQKEIVDSITYAKRIQTALLTSDAYIKEYLPAEHFVLFKPKDIVSGDFYWGLNITQLPGWDLGTNNVKLHGSSRRRNTFYLIAADCTGHGVPGAFMSMLNISYLNENVIERNIRLPHDILNAQRKEIIQALNPEGSTEISKDGMDCVLCAYDFDKMLLHFAAANNSLWLIRNGELTEYKGDKMPVGKYDEVIKPFNLQTIELQKGDIIYTSTDGFMDQFGTSGKKLMKKRFKEELVKIHHLPMKEQKEYLDNYFESWKGNNEQVDDVCVIGVKI